MLLWALCACICSNEYFHFLLVYVQEGNYWSYGGSSLGFWVFFLFALGLLLRTAWFSKFSSFTTLSCGAQASHCGGFSCCGAQALGTWASVDAAQGLISCWFSSRRLMDSRTQTQWLWCTGFSCPRHVGSSKTRDQTSFPCIARQILNHWTTREAPSFYFLKTSSQF